MVSFVNSVTIIVARDAGSNATLALISFITLLILLIQKELVMASKARLAKRLNAICTIGILPLLLVLAWVAAAKFLEFSH